MDEILKFLTVLQSPTFADILDYSLQLFNVYFNIVGRINMDLYNIGLVLLENFGNHKKSA